MPRIMLTEDTIPEILILIDTWKGKLTWPLLCKEVAATIGVGSIERQSLAAYKEIQAAYTERKEKLRVAGKVVPSSVSDDVTVEFLKKEVEKLKAENARLKEANERYKQRFVLWQYNAYTNGVRVKSLDEASEMLDKPLHRLNRKDGG